MAKRKYKHPVIHVLLNILLFFLFLIWLAEALLIIPMLPNDVRLARFSWQLFHAPLPEQTQRLAKAKECGRFWGTGDGMEFMAVIIVESDLSQAELEEYYAGLGFRPAHRNSGRRVYLDVVAAVPGQSFRPAYYYRDEVPLADFPLPDTSRGIYYIAIYDGTYFPWFDLRGT